ncbi:Coiled-coil domain-containing protein 22 [Phytophthora citrophthora]|uniref:Coiled-coil domain-containing protein 22 n=1 Tax=Phytophthora citrophthora TaxID=4793 RepID=A0AAD9LTS8_9STRA|nr:Coiled-coil domain-containing protein 22 [Phytophthora citrophthora]
MRIMAEADAFIFAALQQSGWLEDAADASNWTVADLSSDAFIVVVSKFLARLHDEDDSASFTLPSTHAKAPVGVAARHRVGSQMANILKELGYAGDCGYNHFLYPNEKETRNILSWLVGKLPRSKQEEKDEEDGKTQALASISAGPKDSASVLEDEHLASIFSSWKREKTLHVMPNRDLEGLRGFQRLPLRTSPLELRWNRQEQSTHKLFEGFPTDCVKATSLLEALAVAKRGSTMLLREAEFEEEIEDRQLKQKLHGDSLKDVPSAGESGFLVPQEGEAEDDRFTTIQLQSFLSSALPDVPLSGGNQLLGATGLPEGGIRMESTGSAIMDTTKEAQATEQEEREEQSLEEVQKQVEDTEQRIAAMRKVLDRERGELLQVEQHVVQTQTTGQEMQKELARHKQLVAMLPQAQANIAKLEAICQANVEKKAEVAAQMKLARDPLLKEYAELQGQKSSRKARCRQLIREIKEFRAEMQEVTGIIHSKMESVRALEKIHERQMNKLGKKGESEDGTMTRNKYTSRIMDIIKQVHKQKQDIAKILEDINGLQKQLNVASEKLKRTEAVAEEKLYSAASKSKVTSSTKSEAYVECYRKFAQVRELFEELILVVGDVGKKENTARDLQNWISQLEARDSSSHLDKVLADLESVRLENGSLQNELRAGKR